MVGVEARQVFHECLSALLGVWRIPATEIVLMSDFIQGELIYYAHRLSPLFKELLIVPIADCHYGSPLFSEKHLVRLLDYIKEHGNCYAVCMGDLCDSVLANSVGNIYEQKITPQQQRDQIIEWLLPIKDRILGMVGGNHEARIYRNTGIDITKDIASALHVPYRAEGIMLKVSFGTYRESSKRPYTYFLYCNHGYGGARTKAAKAVKVERLATFIHCDAYIMAHDHDVNVATGIYLQPDPRNTLDKGTGFTVGKVVAHSKMLVKTNAFIKFGGYGESGGFAPVSLRFPVIRLSGNGRKEITVEVSSG